MLFVERMCHEHVKTVMQSFILHCLCRSIQRKNCLLFEKAAGKNVIIHSYIAVECIFNRNALLKISRTKHSIQCDTNTRFLDYKICVVFGMFTVCDIRCWRLTKCQRIQMCFQVANGTFFHHTDKAFCAITLCGSTHSGIIVAIINKHVSNFPWRKSTNACQQNVLKAFACAMVTCLRCKRNSPFFEYFRTFPLILLELICIFVFQFSQTIYKFFIVTKLLLCMRHDQNHRNHIQSIH